MESNRVKVKIYGQEYTIIGEKNEESIKGIASYVDNKMHEIGKNSFLGSATSLAVLSAVNITDEMMSAKNDIAALEKKNKALNEDVKKYVDLWDEAKKDILKHKSEIEALRAKAEDDSRIKELEAKYKELEADFFDLQMENIKLKSRLEELEDNE